MKNLKLLTAAIAVGLALPSMAQLPTISPVSGPKWDRGGNTFAPGGGNVFGTFFSSPIYHFTDSQLRLKMNDNVTNSVNTLPLLPRNGFIGIGPDLGGVWTTGPGPFSLLHLNGSGTFVQQGGYRNWMQTGVTLTSNNDLAYMGHKQNGPGTDITDLVLAWSDNSTGPFPGPDVMKFVFTAGTGSAGNDLTGDHVDGREIMRMHGTGNVGIGPRFNNTAGGQPQSQLHINSQNNVDNFFQMTVQSTTGQLASDGFRINVVGTNGDVRLNQQENAHMLFFQNTTSGSGGERMRVTSVATSPTPNPGSIFPADRTRVSISHSPFTPVTQPRSLLHLGYNTQNPAGDGWRNWMDVGMFVSQGSDNVFIGLKQETASAPFGDSFDAVINWGDNEPFNLPPGSGPDNMRFIFTSTTTGIGSTSPGNSANGVEGMRMTPTVNPTTLNTQVLVGVGGDPTIPNTYTGGGNNPTNTLEVNSYGSVTTPGGSSGLRFTDLKSTTPTITNPGQGVLAVDVNGDVIYVPGGGGTNFFQCNPTVPTTADDLPFNSWWELNNFNFVFSGQGGTNNSVGIGTTCTPAAKLHVDRQLVAPAIFNPVAFRVDHSDVSLPGPLLGLATGMGSIITGANRQNTAGLFNASGATSNFGVQGITTATAGTNIAASFNSANATGSNIGVTTNASGPSSSIVIGVNANAVFGSTNYGGRFFANSNTGLNYGIWAESLPVSGSTPPTGPNFAGYFNGDVLRTGTDNFTSDVNLKTNIDTITNSLGIIAQLEPKTFDFNVQANPQMGLPRTRQYGLIAQDVEAILPELVGEATHPATFDSAGNQITPAVNFKTLNYNAFIGILIDGMKKQQETIENLTGQVNALSAQVSGCCSNANARTGENSAVTMKDVELGGNVVVLEQNVPNPFADQTTINYFIPDNVGFAQILFYDNLGRVIKTVDINEKGKGQLNVFASNLANGMYSYTLVVDGKVVDTKKMVKN